MGLQCMCVVRVHVCSTVVSSQRRSGSSLQRRSGGSRDQGVGGAQGAATARQCNAATGCRGVVVGGGGGDSSHRDQHAQAGF